MQHRWILPSSQDEVATNHLSSELGISRVAAELLAARGFSTTEEAALFLDPRLASLSPPEEILGMTQGFRTPDRSD
jgi:hypothetical protein